MARPEFAPVAAVTSAAAGTRDSGIVAEADPATCCQLHRIASVEQPFSGHGDGRRRDTSAVRQVRDTSAATATYCRMVKHLLALCRCRTLM